jgi:peptide/nickel transport system substrate-binding protein
MVSGVTGQRAIPRRLNRRTVLTSTGVGVLLAACRGTNVQNSHGSSSAGSGQNGRPRSGGILRNARRTDAGDSGDFDPAKKSSDVAASSFAYNTLLGPKTGPSVGYSDLTLRPELAESWETPDPQTYIFHLNKSVRFANLPPVNGRELTSADAKWTYEYLSRTGDMQKLPAANSQTLFSGLNGIEAQDPATLVVRFKEPFVPFLSYAATNYLPILAHEIFDADGDFTKRLVGSGPFQLDTQSSKPGSAWIFKKNPGYFQQGQPYLDQLNWLVLPDDASQQAAFQTGQLDILSNDDNGLEFNAYQQIKKSVPNAAGFHYPDPREPYIYMNVTKPPLNDVRIRQAINLALDRDAFIKTTAQGQGEWAAAAALPGLFTQEELKQFLKHDPAEAKRLVQAAGYSGGLDIEFTFTRFSDTFASIVQLFQAQVKPAGINIKLHELDSAVDAARRRTRDYFLDITPGPPGLASDPDSILYPLFYPENAGNRGGVNDPDLTSLLVAQRRETDPDKRRAIVRQAVRRINEVPWAVALYYPTSYWMWSPNVKNYFPNLAREEPVTDCWLEK